MEEIWKDIEGYEGLYQVSNLGRIKSLKRKNNYGRYVKERIRKVVSNKDGYLCVTLSDKGRQKTFTVHGLVAKAFICKTLENVEVNHKNGIKTDNRKENLEWITHKANVQHTYLNLNRRAVVSEKGHIIGKNNPMSKIILQIEPSNNKVVSEFYSLREAYNKTKINRGNICNCCNGKSKTAGGYIWRYKEE